MDPKWRWKNIFCKNHNLVVYEFFLKMLNFHTTWYLLSSTRTKVPKILQAESTKYSKFTQFDELLITMRNLKYYWAKSSLLERPE